jgi:hypothetical protein
MRHHGKVRVWTTTNVENLLRHKGGGYYGRFRVAGKRKLVCFKTSVFSVAKLRLHDEAGRVNQQRGATVAVQSGDVTMRDLAKTYVERFESLEITDASKRDRHISLKRLIRSWLGFEALPPKAIGARDCRAWANRLKSEGSGFRPKFSRRPAKKGVSGGAVNRSITALQQMLDLAVEIGAVHVNVARLKAPAGYGRLRKNPIPSRCTRRRRQTCSVSWMKSKKPMTPRIRGSSKRSARTGSTPASSVVSWPTAVRVWRSQTPSTVL